MILNAALCWRVLTNLGHEKGDISRLCSSLCFYVFRISANRKTLTETIRCSAASLYRLLALRMWVQKVRTWRHCCTTPNLPCELGVLSLSCYGNNWSRHVVRGIQCGVRYGWLTCCAQPAPALQRSYLYARLSPSPLSASWIWWAHI